MLLAQSGGEGGNSSKTLELLKYRNYIPEFH